MRAASTHASTTASCVTGTKEHGINARQFHVLAVLARDPDLSQGELARRVMVTPQSMSELLASLVAAGLVEREGGECGRRAAVRLARPGEALLARARPVVEAANAEGFAALTDTERGHLRKILRKLLGLPLTA